VDNRARRFPSFPFDHLFTSGSRKSANLWNIKEEPNNEENVDAVRRWSYPCIQMSYMFLCLLSLNHQVTHVLLSKGFWLQLEINISTTNTLQNIKVKLEKEYMHTTRSVVRWCLSILALCLKPDSASTTTANKSLIC
jgi:hypothetical protein